VPTSVTPGSTPPAPRRSALDRPGVLAVAVLGLVAGLVGLVRIANRTTDISPLLSDVVTYTLFSVDFSILAALCFVLARNLWKLWIEQRQAVPFARFRAKLVGALLLLTIIPAGLVLITGSEIISSSFDRWFSVPAEEVLDAAKNLARIYYDERQAGAANGAHRLARDLPLVAITHGDLPTLQTTLGTELGVMRSMAVVGTIEVYQAVRAPGGEPDAALLVQVGSATLPPNTVRAAADRLAARAITSGHDEPASEDLDDGGALVRMATPIAGADGVVAGAVVYSEYVAAAVGGEQRKAMVAFDKYQQVKVLRGPLQGVYIGIYLGVALLILISATWFGLYTAKRITRPVQMLAEGTRAIGAGRLDLRLEPETTDELGSLVESFNMMAAELRSSQEKLELSRRELEAKNDEVDGRRRYIETILERVATGVLSLGADGAILTVNGAAERLLGLDPHVIGQPATQVFGRDDLRPLLPLADVTSRPEAAGVVQEITLSREDREIQLAAAATVLTGEGGRIEGAVLVLDDVTPLIRAQRVAAWRDVARRLAHEIKNPLTPIQLSAERLRRNFQTAAPATRALVDECTGAIVVEVEALKTLVDEFAQFARMRGPRAVPTNLNRIVDDTLQLYAGILQQGRLVLEPKLERDLPSIRMDGEQIRQVIINLVDNAVEALGGPHAPDRPDGHAPRIVVATGHDAGAEVVRLVIRDNGPGVPAADHDKLFLPYFSTKGRGSGLGLAIVRRIVTEHGGTITVGEAQPGTMFTVELPTT
jgi:two-component system nitrogen regulation sensor histidine kinase NtrY